jgi:hypothetical protein
LPVPCLLSESTPAGSRGRWSRVAILPGDTAGRVHDTVRPRAGGRVALIQPPWAAIMARLRAKPAAHPTGLSGAQGWHRRVRLVPSRRGPRSDTVTVMPPGAGEVVRTTNRRFPLAPGLLGACSEGSPLVPTCAFGLDKAKQASGHRVLSHGRDRGLASERWPSQLPRAEAQAPQARGVHGLHRHVRDPTSSTYAGGAAWPPAGSA